MLQAFPQLALAGIRLAAWRGAVESIPCVHCKDFFSLGISSYQVKKADPWKKCNPCLQAVSDVLNWTWGFSKADMSFSLRGDLFFWAICLRIRQDYLRPFLLALSLLQNTDRSIESLAGLSWFGEAPKSRVGGCYAFHHQDTRVRLHLLFFFCSVLITLSWGHLPVPFWTPGAVFWWWSV